MNKNQFIQETKITNTCYFIQNKDKYYKINKYTSKNIKLSFIHQNLKKLIFYNCKRSTVSSLAKIESKESIFTNNIKYKKEKLFTKSNHYLGNLKNIQQNIRILTILKLSYS